MTLTLGRYCMQHCGPTCFSTHAQLPRQTPRQMLQMFCKLRTSPGRGASPVYQLASVQLPLPIWSAASGRMPPSIHTQLWGGHHEGPAESKGTPYNKELCTPDRPPQGGHYVISQMVLGPYTSVTCPEGLPPQQGGQGATKNEMPGFWIQK